MFVVCSWALIGAVLSPVAVALIADAILPGRAETHIQGVALTMLAALTLGAVVGGVLGD